MYSLQVLSVNGCLPKRVGGSRWMPHMKTALETLFKSFPGYISHLQNQSNNKAKAEGLATILGSLNVIVFGLVLKELLDPLCRLSLTLQGQHVTLGEANITVLSTVDLLEQLRNEYVNWK